MRSALLTKAPAIGQITDEGAAKKANQDAYLALRIGLDQTETWEAQPGQALYAIGVADGVTGQAAGDYASAIAVRTITRVLRQQKSGAPIPQQLHEALQAANQSILQATAQNPDQRGMSTTIVVAVVDQWQLYLAHLGDSRAYLIRNKVAHQLTLDHTWVQEALDAGRLSEEDAQKHPNRHTLAKHLGVPFGLQVDASIYFPGVNLTRGPRQALPTLPLEAGDAILLCSDGVTDKIRDSEIAQIVSTHKGAPQRAVNQLLKQALARQEGDNITAVLLVMPGGALDALLPPLLTRGQMRPVILGLLTILLILASWFALAGNPFRASSLATQTPTPVQQAAQPATATPITAPPTLVPTTPLTDSAAITGTAVAATMTATSQPSAATTVVPTRTATATVAVTVAATRAVTATTVATAALTSSSTVSATLAARGHVTRTGSGVTTTPTVKPTATRVVLATPTPTITPAPPTPTTATQRATTPVAAPGSNGCAGCTVTLDGPLEAELSGRPTFRWTANFELGNQYLFELVFWEEGQNAMQHGRSPVGAGSSATVAVDLEKAADTLGLRSSANYKWGVLLVDAKDTNKRIRQLSVDQKFQLQLAGGGSSGGDGGNGQPEPGRTPVDQGGG